MNQDWYNKYLVEAAAAFEAKPYPTGTKLVVDIQKMINLPVHDKFGFVHYGTINRSTMNEFKMTSAIQDPTFTHVIDYRITSYANARGYYIMTRDYGAPVYNCGTIPIFGGYRMLRATESDDLKWLEIYLAPCGQTEATRVLKYKNEIFQVAMIYYGSTQGVEVTDYFADGDNNILVDDSNNAFDSGTHYENASRTWYALAEDVQDSKYVEAPFFMVDYKKRVTETLQLQKNKQIFIFE